MSKAEWGYLWLASFFVFWWFATRLDRLSRQLKYNTSLILQEMAELLDKEERTDELREESEEDSKEHKKAARQERLDLALLAPRHLLGGGTPLASIDGQGARRNAAQPDLLRTWRWLRSTG